MGFRLIVFNVESNGDTVYLDDFGGWSIAHIVSVNHVTESAWSVTAVLVCGDAQDCLASTVNRAASEMFS